MNILAQIGGGRGGTLKLYYSKQPIPLSKHTSETLAQSPISPRSRQHQRDIVRLFVLANPVGDRRSNDFRDAL